MNRLLFILLYILIGFTQWAYPNCDSEPNLVVIKNDPLGGSDIISNSGSVGQLGNGTEIEEVCILIMHEVVRDALVKLTSPSGTTITIFDGSLIANTNYALGDDLGNINTETKVCFTMDALLSNALIYGSAIGNWLPSEDFTLFDGESPNGDWALTLIDRTANIFSIIDNPTLVSWSIAFSNGDCDIAQNSPSYLFPEPSAVGFNGLDAEYCINEGSITLIGFPNPEYLDGGEETFTENGFPITNFSPALGEEQFIATSTINVNAFQADDIIIDPEQISVGLNIDHEHNGDIEVYLTAPCGKVISIFNQIGEPQIDQFGSNDAFSGQYFFNLSKNSIEPIFSGPNDVFPEGNYLPEGDFMDLLACSINGTWELTVIDYDSMNVGVLNNWSLTFQQSFNGAISFASFDGPGIVNDADSLSTALFFPDSAGLGTHQITFDYLHFNGQLYSETQTVQIYPKPEIGSLDSIFICSQAVSIDLANYNPVDMMGTSGNYFWYSDAALTQNLNSTVIDQIGTYYLEYISTPSGCADTTSVVVANVEDPIYSITTDSVSYCAGDTIFLLMSSKDIGPTDVIEYNWTGPNGFTSTEAEPIVNADLNAIGTYNLEIVFNGCLQTAVSTNTSFTVNSIPEPYFLEPYDTVVCAFSPFREYTINSGYQNYFWKPKNGYIQDGSDNLDDFILMQWYVGGELYAIVEDQNGCKGSTDTLEIDYVTIEEPEFGDIQVVFCEEKDTVTYQVEQTYNTYTWYVENGEILDGGNGSDFIKIHWLVPNEPAGFSLVVTNDIGCKDSTYRNVDYYGNPDIELLGFQDTVCIKTTTTYATVASYNSYDWTFDASVVSLIDGGGILDSFLTVQWLTPGPKTLGLETNVAGFCNQSFSEEIFVNGLPSINYTAIEDTVCFNKEILFELTEDYADHIWTHSVGTVIDGGNPEDNFIILLFDAVGTTSCNLAVTVTDAFGCVNDLETIFDILPNNTPVFANPSVGVCTGDTVQYSVNNDYLNYVWNVNGGEILSENNNVIEVVWNAIGTVELEATDAIGCVYNISLNVDVVNSPDLAFANPIDALCVTGDTITYQLTQSFTEHYFEVGGGTIVSNFDNTINAVDVVWGNNPLGTILATAINAYGCDTSILQEVQINVFNPIPFIDSVEEVCSEELQTVFSVEDRMGNYTWSVTNGTITSNPNNSSVFIDWEEADGSDGLVAVVFEDASGCLTFSDTLTIIINGLPTPDFMTHQSIVCANDTNILYEIDTSVVIYEDYQWVIDGGKITNGGNGFYYAYVEWGGGMNGQIEVTVTDTNYCSQITVELVDLMELPDPVIVIPSQPICANDTASYSLTLPYQGYEWFVQGGKIIGNTDGSMVEVAWSAEDTTGTLSVNVLGTNGCFNMISEEITLNPFPVPVFADLQLESCAVEDTIYYELTEVFTDYNWEVINGTIISGGATYDTFVAVDWDDNVTMGQFILTLLDVNGCGSIDTFDVVITQIPEINIENFNANLCEKDSITFYQLDNFYHNVIWNVIGGDVMSGGNGTNGIQIDWNTTSNNHSIDVMVETANGCTKNKQFDIDLIEEINLVSVQDRYVICPGDSVQFSISGAVNYAWDNAQTLSDDNSSNPFAFPTETTVYTLVANDGIACEDNIEIVVEVVPNLLFEGNDAARICQGTSYKIDGIRSQYFNNIYWEVISGEGTFSDSNELNPLFTPSSDYHGNVVLRVTAESDCEVMSTELEIFVEGMGLELGIEEDLVDACPGKEIPLSIIPNFDYASVVWSGGDGSFDDPTSTKPYYLVGDNELGLIELTITANTLCETITETIQVMVHEYIEIKAGGGHSIRFGESVDLIVEGDPTGQYVWSPPNGLSCTDCENPIATPFQTTTYTVTSLNNCIVDDELVVNVKADNTFKFPTAFSPNGDGENDKFYPLPVGEGHDFISLVIFNRYGQTVFHATTMSEGWDGVFNGKMQEFGVFTYACEYKIPSESNSIRQIAGNVTLLK